MHTSGHFMVVLLSNTMKRICAIKKNIMWTLYDTGICAVIAASFEHIPYDTYFASK